MNRSAAGPVARLGGALLSPPPARGNVELPLKEKKLAKERRATPVSEASQAVGPADGGAGRQHR